MDFIHHREYLNPSDVVRVDCDTRCNVMLTSDSNFFAYQRGDGYTYFGGGFKTFPALLSPPNSGYWNVTIDIGEGYQADIRYRIDVLKA